jgi:hypothetical protein
VYATIAQTSGEVVARGHAAIVDAVYARPDDREVIERVAATAHVPFVGVWLEAPESVLIARSEQRRLDASDADAAVIRGQLAREPGAINWHRIDASGAFDDVLRTAKDVLRERLNNGMIRSASQAA